MTKTESIFFDLVRFTAAILVFFQHAPGPQFAYWLPWTNLGHISVLIFFVLSGFVIAYVTDKRETLTIDYTASRFSRIYSILLPCLILNVAVVSYIFSSSSEPALIFQESFPEANDAWPLNSVCTLLSANRTAWCLSHTPVNLPLWSISYEVFYYILFGVFMFMRGVTRWAALFAAVLLAGTNILLLFPVWLMGVLLYKIKPLYVLNSRLAWAILILAPATYLSMHYTSIEGNISAYLKALFSINASKLEYSQGFITDYFWGAIIVLVFMAFFAVQDAFTKILLQYERPIRACAKYTFSIYVFHYPLLYFFAVFLDHDPNSILQGVVLIFVALGASVALGSLFEIGFKAWLKTQCLKLAGAAST